MATTTQPSGSNMKKLVWAALTALSSASLAVVAAPGAYAVPMICDPYSTWTEVSSRTNSLQVDSGDYRIWTAASSASLGVTTDFSATAGSSASVSTSTGSTATVGAGVGWFNAG